MAGHYIFVFGSSIIAVFRVKGPEAYSFTGSVIL